MKKLSKTMNQINIKKMNKLKKIFKLVINKIRRKITQKKIQ